MSEFIFYNHEQKIRYITEREISYKSIRNVMGTFFKITKVYEEQLEKDCSNFTATEILNMYASYSSRSWEHLLNFNSQLKIYTNWCLKENLVKDNQNHYEELDKHSMYNCLNIGLKEQMIITRKELEKTLMKIPNVSDQFLALAFFEGLGGAGYSDFYNLMPEQFNNNLVILNNRNLTVSTMLVERAKESAEEYRKFNMDGPMRTGYRLTDTSVVKDSSNAFTDSAFKNTRKIYKRSLKLEKEFGKAYGYIGLKNSGRIDMIKRLMINDQSDDIRATYEKYKEDIEYRYGHLQRIFRWIEENQRFFE